MTERTTSCSVVVTALLLLIHTVKAQRLLTEPRVVESNDGILDISLTIEYADHFGAAHTFRNARLLNGTLPGPTLRLKAGDKMRILFHNQLKLGSNPPIVEENEYRDPDHSNLHFHGAHVTGELPSDDVRLNVKPGDSFQYETDFPLNHMPGTHWMHPHVHGSSALQVGGGAALAFIVDDPPNYLPSQIEDAKEILMVVQNINRNTLEDIIEDIGDEMMGITGGSETTQRDFRIVNGLYQSTIRMQPGEWQRWRIVYASWLQDPLDFQLSNGCEMQLLAKDGIYINDFPRQIDYAPIPTGGRADVMVRCQLAGEYTAIDYDNEVILRVEVTGEKVDSRNLESWSPSNPAYLSDLREESVDRECSCRTRMHGGDSCEGARFCINEEPFDPEVFVHTVEMGEVVEREIEGADNHPYHQHVYPFQIVSNLNNNNDISSRQKKYFQEGDWHDVIMIDDFDDDLTIRYQPNVHDGRIMLHCHRLNHEDRGMMSQENVVENGKCNCNALSRSDPVDPTAEADRSPPSSSFEICFSGGMTVEVKGRGEIPIGALQIGDFVRSEKSEYSRVYSFGHYDENVEGQYLKFDLRDIDSPLEVSPDHMVFLEKKFAVPASDIVVGDILITSNGSSTEVLTIRTVTRRGAYAPFTMSGKIAVSGVVASNYITILGLPHWAAHACLTPRRLYCSIFFHHCKEEIYEGGVATRVTVPLRLAQWVARKEKTINTLFRVLVVSFVFVMHSFESLIANPVYMLVLLVFVKLFLSKIGGKKCIACDFGYLRVSSRKSK